MAAAAARRSFHNRCNNYDITIQRCRLQNNNGTTFSNTLKQNDPGHNLNNYCIQKRLLSSSHPASPPSSSSQSISKNAATTNMERKSNAFNKYFTTKTNQDNAPTSIETELSQLRAEISNLSYLIKQTASQQTETQALSRRAEARAYIIEHKLMDIQSHVVKIPALENMSQNFRQYMKDYRPPAYVSDALRKVNESSASFLTSKYTAWLLFGGVVVFWQYRVAMYQRTSEEVANVAALTLQQDSLRKTIQETLTTVANSPETLASLSALFQKLITEERTEQHLINLIVRALNSEGVRDAAINLLDVCFQNPYLQTRAGDFLKVAANATVLDDQVQRSAGVGLQQALKSAVLPWWVKNLHHTKSNVEENGKDGDSPDVGDAHSEPEKNGAEAVHGTDPT